MGMPKFRKLKKELGFSDAANEYIEVLLREAGSKSLTEDRFQELANKHSIKVNDFSFNDAALQIRKSYIVSVYKSFESFLSDIDKDIRTYTACNKEREEGKSLLYHVYSTVFGMKKKNDRNYLLYLICDYYRLLRNSFAHRERDKALQDAYSAIIKHPIEIQSIFPRLKITEDDKKTSFDDFILYSRASKALAYAINKNIPYDIRKVVESIDLSTIKHCSNNSKRITGWAKTRLEKEFELSANQKEEAIVSIIHKLQ